MPPPVGPSAATIPHRRSGRYARFSPICRWNAARTASTSSSPASSNRHLRRALPPRSRFAQRRHYHRRDGQRAVERRAYRPGFRERVRRSTAEPEQTWRWFLIPRSQGLCKPLHGRRQVRHVRAYVLEPRPCHLHRFACPDVLLMNARPTSVRCPLAAWHTRQSSCRGGVDQSPSALSQTDPMRDNGVGPTRGGCGLVAGNEREANNDLDVVPRRAERAVSDVLDPRPRDCHRQLSKGRRKMNAAGIGPCMPRCSRRSSASGTLGRWPAGTHQRTGHGSRRSNHLRRRRIAAICWGSS